MALETDSVMVMSQASLAPNQAELEICLEEQPQHELSEEVIELMSEISSQS